jgi:hypothetical protein
MAPTRHPLIDLVYNDETGRYIGVLETKLTVYQLENLRMRALLELLTGDMWDDYDFGPMDERLFDIAVDALMRRCQMSQADARQLCEDRWKACNPPEPDPSLATYMVGLPTATPHVISHARQLPGGAKFDHKKHLEGLEKSRRDRETPRD